MQATTKKKNNRPTYIPNKRPKNTFCHELSFKAEEKTKNLNLDALKYIRKRKIGNIIDFIYCDNGYKSKAKQYRGIVKKVCLDKFFINVRIGCRVENMMINKSDIIDGTYKEVQLY